MSLNKTENSDVSLAHKLLECLTGSWITQAIYVAAELGIADLLAKGPRTNEDLATATNTHAPSLHRFLRALTTIEICREGKDGSFEITPMGSLLGTGVPGSMRCFAIWWGKYLWPVWGNLLYSIKTGESARKLLTGTEGFKHLEHNPEAAAVFNQAIAELTRLTTRSVVLAYDFSDLKRIVDVGGGYGELLASILKANPSVTGILFDLPHAIDGARQLFEEMGLADRCELVSGDFFESVPSGADAYMLKSVIHDWNNERSKQILENCLRAMNEGARLIIIERILPCELRISKAHQAAVRSDLTMLVAHAAQERTEADFKDLLNSAGFKITRILPVDPTFNIIEAFPLY